MFFKRKKKALIDYDPKELDIVSLRALQKGADGQIVVGQ